jgi:hypothetical protein
MIGPGWSRVRGHLVCAAVVVLGAGLVSVPAVSAASSATGLSGFSTTGGSVRVGGELWDGVSVSPKAARAVTVQYRRAGTNVFKNAYTGSTSARGAITLGLQPPAAGRWQFRAVVAASSRAAKFVSSTRTVVATGRAVRTDISGYATTSATISVGATVTDDVVLSPRAPRAVVVQARGPGSVTFVSQSTGTSSSSGSFRAVYRPTSAGVWGFRLAVSASATALSVTSPTRIITATATDTDPPGPDVTAPGPVTGLTVSGLTNKTATLSWTNPPDADLSGAVIRRADGATAPATVTDGTAVTDVPVPASTFTDTGLTPDTTYSYAVFAHDGAPNYAAAGTVTLTTASAPDLTAPGPVTHLRDTRVTGTTVTMTWQNPPDADFTGVTIVRGQGSNAPKTIHDVGAMVFEKDQTATTFTDTGLTAKTTYSYAVFAHDATPNHADGATLTVKTTSATTDAVLSVRPLGLPINTDNKLTVNTLFRFDASDSLAAEGKSLVSATLNYGDGQTYSFSDPFGPTDFWNTEHTYTNSGPKTVTLTVTDSAGTTATTTDAVTVLDAPTATVSVTSGPARVGAPVMFKLDTTTPDAAGLSSYALNIAGDDYFHFTGNTAPPTTKTITFTVPGDYTIAFSVANDAGGAPDASQITIHVAAT